MKHALISAALVLAMLALCLFSMFRVRAAALQSEQALERAQALSRAEDAEGAQRALSRAQARWAQDAFLFGVVLHHAEYDEVMERFAEAAQYLQSGEESDFQAACAALRVRLLHLRQMELPSLQNILCACAHTRARFS